MNHGRRTAYTIGTATTAAATLTESLLRQTVPTLGGLILTVAWIALLIHTTRQDTDSPYSESSTR